MEGHLKNMIKKLTIDNLKSIRHLEMECANINLLIGTNSSGKSSIMQGLLFLEQNNNKPVGLNGEFMSLGTFEENKCAYCDGKEISVSIEDQQENSWTMRLFYASDQLTIAKTMDDQVDMPNMQYLSCHRIGPQNVYKKDMGIGEQTIGINGQYAIAYLNEHGMDPLEECLCKDLQNLTLAGQLNWWLKYIVGVEISTEEIIGADLVKASYTMNDRKGIRPVNIGSGVSYLISVLVMCLASSDGDILLIENPEIHLHPSAQAKVCEFFDFIARANRQLFIESHSDHIFNGFRVGITTGTMDPEKINLQFIKLNEEYVTEAARVRIGRMGRIENQQKDLFDQFDLDMNRMIGVRGV